MIVTDIADVFQQIVLGAAISVGIATAAVLLLIAGVVLGIVYIVHERGVPDLDEDDEPAPAATYGEAA